MTRKNSGVSAPRASASPETAPAFHALGVVTADGGLTIPPAVLDRMAADALAANREQLASYAPLIVEIENSEGAAKSDAAARLAAAVISRTAYKRPADEVMDIIRKRGGVDPAFRERLGEVHAKLAAFNDKTERELDAKYGPALRLVPPVQPSTPCPAWCDVEHDSAALDGDRSYHHSPTVWSGPAGLYVDVRDDGTASLALSLGSDPELLDLDEVDALIASLTEHRALLAAVSPAAPGSQHTAGGAA